MPKISLSRDWVCNGRELKPKYGANSNNNYEFDGNPIFVAFGQLILKLW